MKKGLSILLIAAMVVFATLCGIGPAMAEEESTINIEVGSALTIVGNGTMSRSLLAQSGWGYEGQRLVEEMYSSYRGTLGPSTIDYSSDLNMYVGSSEILDNETTTEIAYASTVFTSNMKREVCAKNYEVGTVSGVRTAGNSLTALEVDMSPNSNYLMLEGTVDGKAKLSHMVVDPVTKLRAVKEVTRLDGAFTLDYEAFAEKLVDVGDDGDWLGCP